MNRHLVSVSMLILLCAGSAGVVVAQETQPPKTAATTAAPASGFRAEILRQLEDAEKKLIALSEAVPQEKYSWRPAEGVRSMSEVFMHVAGGNFFLTQAAGVKPPAEFNRDMEKISDKAKVTEALKRSFAHVRQAAANTPDAELEKAVNLFGRNTTVRDVYLLLATHAHEHLGQAIAYARMNNVVPPWSTARQAPRQ